MDAGAGLLELLGKLEVKTVEKELYLPPPIFSDVDTPKEYNFKGGRAI